LPASPAQANLVRLQVTYWNKIMKFLFTLFTIDFRAILHRFPVPVFLAALGTLLGILYPAAFQEYSDDFYAFCFCGFLASFAVTVYGESRNLRALTTRLLSLLAALSTLLIFMTAFETADAFFFLAPAIGLFVLVAPYLHRGSDEAVCYYDCVLLNRVMYAFLMAGILFAGIAGVLFTLEELFNLRFYGWSLYGNTAIVIFGFLAPLYFLSGVPHDYDAIEQKPYPREIRFLIHYILVPLVWVYFVILYAYMARILILGELPKGILGTIIPVFGICGAIAHLYTVPLVKEGGRALQLLHRWFYPALLPPLVMLFVAIGTRINAYGLTEQRVAIVLIGVWLLGAALWVIFRKNTQLRLLPIGLSILLLLASFGPWKAASLAVNSQLTRLETLLTKYDRLKDGKLQKTETDILAKDAEQIHEALKYLADNKAFETVRGWYAAQNPHIIVNNEWELDPLLKAYNILSPEPVSQDNALIFNATNSSVYVAIPVKGYDYASRLTLYRDKGLVIPMTQEQKISLFNNNSKITLNFSDKSALLSYDLVAALKKHGQPSQGYYRDGKPVTAKPVKPITLTQENKNWRVSLYIINLSGREEQEPNNATSFKLTESSFYVLIDDKRK
jgi:hypothetical protein